MTRGYDVIFQNKMLGYLLSGALSLLFIAMVIWGSLHVKRIMAADSAARKKYKEEHPTPNDPGTQ